MTHTRQARRFVVAAALLLLSACAGPQQRGSAPVSVQIIAFNDFHGALEPPHLAVVAPAPGGGTVRVPAGGVAYLASAIAERRAGHANSIVVAAGDLIGASPLSSGLFLDEPTVEALNLIHLDLSAIGNHEFDKGRAELQRLTGGGCATHTARTPCLLDPRFPGARFGFLAANVAAEDGRPFFPPYAIRSFGRGRDTVKVAFIGLTLRGATALVSPAGIAGLTFGDEADAANALVPELRRAGADAIVILIHQGGQTSVGYDDKSCAGLKGEILPILARLDPAIDVVVSGHTHKSYVCDYGVIDTARPILLTSAGLYGTLFTDIGLTIDPRAHRVVSKQADNVIVQGEAYVSADGPVPLTDLYPRQAKAPALAALVDRAVAAAAPLAGRIVGHLGGPASRTQTPSHETVLGDLIADSYLAATREPDRGGARVAFMNPGGVRAELTPAADGSVSYGQIFVVQPFGNTAVVKSMTGRQIVALLEQQFGGTHSVAEPYVLAPSASFRYAYDLSRPAGSRILTATVDGMPIDSEASYRVTMNNFLASGGDGFTMFTQGTAPIGGALDLDALEAYFTTTPIVALPVADRIANRTPAAAAPAIPAH